MQKQEYLINRHLCPGIHLRSTAFRTLHDIIREAFAQGDGIVRASAINNDDLVPLLSPLLEWLKGGFDALGFVVGGDDDGGFHFVYFGVV
jgi:hypothetical protein